MSNWKTGLTPTMFDETAECTCSHCGAMVGHEADCVSHMWNRTPKTIQNPFGKEK